MLPLQLDSGCEGVLDIGDQVLSVLNTDRQTDQVLGDAKSSTVLSADGAVGHGGGQLAQRLDTSERLGKGEELDVTQESVGSGQVTLDAERDHTTETLLLGLGQLVLGVRGQARVDDILDTGGGLEDLGNGQGALGVLLHAQVQGLQTTVGQEAVKGRRNGTDRVLEEGELGVDLLVGGDGNTHDDIRVSVDVLGDRVDNNVGTELERVLEEGRHEGVVDNELGVVLVGNLGNGLDVNETEGGVGGGLDPDELGVGADGLGNVGGILEIDKGDLDVEGAGDLGEVAVGASIDVVD